MKKNNSKPIIKLTNEGEILHGNEINIIEEKYKPDNLFFRAPVSYILMVLCCVIDLAFFKSLFETVSYDSPEMIPLEIAVLAFGADIVAAYAGVVAKQIRQGVRKGKGNLILLLLVPIISLIVNGFLRVSTMSIMVPPDSIVIDPATKALTMTAIVAPILTSVGNFAISFECYNPLAVKMKREEISIELLKDICRRFRAVITDYECDANFEERLQKIDEEKLINAKKILINDAFILNDYVRVKMMEYLGDPTATNILSKSKCEEITSKLDSELKAMESMYIEKTTTTANNKKSFIKPVKEAV
ncbi:MAG: hypothetical protein K6G88_07195 [Lachnospiraceae bacterium]|nr:hypothetical protein [Lachnospiraceae bacterium]